MATYYVVKEGNLLVMRQTRFKAALEQGSEHPHDVCAYATSREEMQDMIDKYFSGDVDFSTLK